MKKVIQYYTIICANLLALSYGIAVGWASPVLPILQSDETPLLLYGKLNPDEVTWLSSIFYIGVVFGSLIIREVADRLGRKVALYVTTIPLILSWIVLILASNFMELFIARFLIGLAGGGTHLTIPVYVTEIAEDKIRGALGSLIQLISHFGVVLGYIWGGYLSYNVMAYLALIFPVLFIIGFFFIPETPEYLISKNKMDEAVKSLKFFRGYNKKSDIFTLKFEKELENLKAKVNLRLETSKLCVQDFTRRSARYALFISIILFITMQSNGGFMLLNYVGPVFNDAGTPISPNMASIIAGSCFVAGFYVATILVDRVGRKPLMLFSCIASAGCLCITGIYFYAKFQGYDTTNYSWVPIVSIAAFYFITALGIIALPFVIANEMMPLKIRGVVSMGLRIISSLTGFLLIKYFYVMKDAFELHGTMCFFAINCLVTALIMFIWLPETKGRPVDEIIASLEKLKL